MSVVSPIATFGAATQRILGIPELNRHKLASDPMFQGWRSLFAGVIEIEVYEEVIAND